MRVEQLIKEAEEGVETQSETAVEGDNASGVESGNGHADGTRNGKPFCVLDMEHMVLEGVDGPYVLYQKGCVLCAAMIP